jgi:hypothetical protein
MDILKQPQGRIMRWKMNIPIFDYIPIRGPVELVIEAIQNLESLRKHLQSSDLPPYINAQKQLEQKEAEINKALTDLSHKDYVQVLAYIKSANRTKTGD